MPNYAWKGRNRAGLIKEGVLAADSKEVALASLRRQNIVVTGIRERGKGRSGYRVEIGLRLLLKRKVVAGGAVFIQQLE